jgi:hypothetical protein
MGGILPLGFVNLNTNTVTGFIAKKVFSFFVGGKKKRGEENRLIRPTYPHSFLPIKYGEFL